MAFGTQDDTDEVMNEINMTPMVDVMLVLLIIFIVTIPVLKHSVNVQLPSANSTAQPQKPLVLRLNVAANGDYFLNDSRISATLLQEVLVAESRKEPQPDVHLYGDKAVPYEKVAQAMSMASSAGLKKIGFVTEPTAQ